MFFSQTRSPFASLQLRFRPRTLLALALVLVLGLAALPPTSRAQQVEIPDFCTIFQQSPQTEDAISVVNDEWNADNESWESDVRFIQSFNGDTLSELTFQELDESGNWRDTLRATPEYDASDRLTLCTAQSKQDDGYVNSLRNDYQYNNDGRLDTLLTERWDTTNTDGEWVNSIRRTFEYDDNGNDTLQVDEVWDSTTQTWNNLKRSHRMYDAQNRIELERQEEWDLLTQAWENDRRTQYTYSSDSREEVDETWDGSDWVKDERRTTMLNSNGLPDSTLTEDWDGSDWVNDERDSFTYTTHDNTQKFERIVTEIWDASASEWENENRTRFSYTTIIPVELARFEVQRTGESEVHLTWETASETNNSGFAVQRQVESGAIASWNTIQFVEGAGTTSEPQSYRFTDGTVPFEAETVRYRLKQVDLDGTTHLSNVVELRLGTPERLALHAPFPNPSRNETTVRYELPEASKVQIVVYDLLGRRVATPVDRGVDAGHAQFQLRTQHLPSGTYLLHLRTAEQTRTQRLTIVK